MHLHVPTSTLSPRLFETGVEQPSRVLREMMALIGACRETTRIYSAINFLIPFLLP
jgi:hypothetical protein